MKAHITVAGQMQEYPEILQLYKNYKEVCFPDLREPMINVQKRSQTRLGHTEVAQEALAEEPP